MKSKTLIPQNYIDGWTYKLFEVLFESVDKEDNRNAEAFRWWEYSEKTKEWTKTKNVNLTVVTEVYRAQVGENEKQ